MRLLYLLILMLGLSYQYSTAQKIDYPADFLDRLAQMSLTFIAPLESDYRDVTVLKNDVQAYDFAIRSRKEKMEIRYILEPTNNDVLSNIPDIQFTRLLTQLASNDVNASPMAVHAIEAQELQEVFRADWGRLAYFQPKDSFAHWRHAKLLSLFKAEKGTTHVLFLFKKPSIHLDHRFYAVQFVEE
ncbi:MAG: hypothetical protein AAF847_01755 [Bacteroidota bacterium]